MITLDYGGGGFVSDDVIKIFILIEHYELDFFYIATKSNTKILYCNKNDIRLHIIMYSSLDYVVFCKFYSPVILKRWF